MDRTIGKLEGFCPLVGLLWNRLMVLREDERGMTTETVIITALLAAAAFAVVWGITQAIGRKGTTIEQQIDR